MIQTNKRPAATAIAGEPKFNNPREGIENMDTNTTPAAGGAIPDGERLQRSMIEVHFEDVVAQAREVLHLNYCVWKMHECVTRSDISRDAHQTLCENAFARTELLMDFIGFLADSIEEARA